MDGCTSCRGGWRSLLSSKLGRCPRCMRASALGTAITWAGAAVASAAWPHPALLALSVLVAAGFTVLLLAHLVAFSARMAALWAALRASAPAEVQQRWPGRRVFLTSLAGAVLAAFLPLDLGQNAARAPFARAAELLGVAYPPPAKCDCPPKPKSPKAPCPTCNCDAPVPVPPDKLNVNPKPCTAANKGERTTTQSEKEGDCKGTLAGCAGKCKKTKGWQCTDWPVGTGQNFRWMDDPQALRTTDNCPPVPESKAATDNQEEKEGKKVKTGKCVGAGCKVPGADCVATQKWRCGKDTDGKWEEEGPPTNDCVLK